MFANEHREFPSSSFLLFLLHLVEQMKLCWRSNCTTLRWVVEERERGFWCSGVGGRKDAWERGGTSALRPWSNQATVRYFDTDPWHFSRGGMLACDLCSKQPLHVYFFVGVVPCPVWLSFRVISRLWQVLFSQCMTMYKFALHVVTPF